MSTMSHQLAASRGLPQTAPGLAMKYPILSGVLGFTVERAPGDSARAGGDPTASASGVEIGAAWRWTSKDNRS